MLVPVQAFVFCNIHSEVVIILRVTLLFLHFAYTALPRKIQINSLNMPKISVLNFHRNSRENGTIKHSKPMFVYQILISMRFPLLSKMRFAS